MFRIIKSYKSIFSMAFLRSKALETAKKNAEPLLEHIIKCIVYEDSTGDWEHWVKHEMTPWLDQANNIEVKTRTGKLSKSDYESTLFRSFGTSLQDADILLFQFKDEKVRQKHQYPHFVVTSSIMHALKDAQNEIREEFSELFSKKNHLGRSQIYNRLNNILKDSIEFNKNR